MEQILKFILKFILMNATGFVIGYIVGIFSAYKIKIETIKEIKKDIKNEEE